MVQNAAARLLSGVRKYQHISPTLAVLHWLPIRFCVDFKVLMITYKTLNGLEPQYLADRLHPDLPESPVIASRDTEGGPEGKNKKLGLLSGGPLAVEHPSNRNSAGPLAFPPVNYFSPLLSHAILVMFSSN